MRKRREDFWALKDVSFEVQRAEALGIIGHNGAGKSTILKLLSRITTPTDGEIMINGRLSALIEVGSGFHPELTGRENMYLNGSILGMLRREITNKLDSIVAFAELRQFIDTPVKRYSSGMYVRLGFSIAAHLDPDIIAFGRSAGSRRRGVSAEVYSANHGAEEERDDDSVHLTRPARRAEVVRSRDTSEEGPDRS